LNGGNSATVSGYTDLIPDLDHNTATGPVLAQRFPWFAIIEPRSLGEIASTWRDWGVKQTAQEVACLIFAG
jgi:hypothetical protein